MRCRPLAHSPRLARTTIYTNCNRSIWVLGVAGLRLSSNVGARRGRTKQVVRVHPINLCFVTLHIVLQPSFATHRHRYNCLVLQFVTCWTEANKASESSARPRWRLRQCMLEADALSAVPRSSTPRERYPSPYIATHCLSRSTRCC